MNENKETTILDFVKAILTPWKRQIPAIPPLDEETKNRNMQRGSMLDLFQLEEEDDQDEEQGTELGMGGWIRSVSSKVPLIALFSLVLALIAQGMLEPSFRTQDSILSKLVPQLPFVMPEYHYVILPVLMYFLSAIFLTISIFMREWNGVQPEPEKTEPFNLDGRWFILGIGTPILIVIAFLAFHFSGSGLLVSNEFNLLDLTAWLILIGFVIYLIWQPEENGFFKKTVAFFQKLGKDKSWRINITFWAFLIIVIVGISILFRTHQFVELPKEMFSDQAEKLLDVGDVLAGKFAIFFTRNTGREGFQMYLTALIVTLFGTGLTYTSLKIGTILAGLLTLPYIYKLGKELGNLWVGAFAMLLAGIAYWPNVIARIGLRFPLYPLFVAPTLFYLIRGMRRSNRNDFILSGIALGIGLHGYSPMRIVPFVVVIGLAIYLLHQSAKGKRWQAIAGVSILALVSFVIFLPLFTYMLSNPEMFGFRAFSRLGTIEKPYPGPVWLIFLDNLKNASTMFFWDNGGIWVNSVPYRPALDFVTGALYFMGVIYLIIRYFQKRIWTDLFLLLCVPLLMLPSILSLAYPGENPALNRTGGAIVPVFIIAAIGLEGVLSSIAKKSSSKMAGTVLAGIVGFVLIWTACTQNYAIVFDDFKTQYDYSAWNTIEMGGVVKGFVDSVGYSDTAYVIPYPYWVDTRLVGINAGFPQRDFALAQANLSQTLEETRTQMFIFFYKDDVTKTKLQELYPNGILTLHKADLDGKDFYIYLVPGAAQ